MEENFEDLVEKAIKKLPQEIKSKIKNIAICVVDEPSKGQLSRIGLRKKENLLGLYEGVPKNTWGRGFGNNLPDKITIFKKSIEKNTSDPRKKEELIKNVVWHEIAHHFGFDEKDAQRLGRKKG